MMVPVETLKRLKAEALEDAITLPMTCHSREVFEAQADGFQAAIDLELENRNRHDSVTAEIGALNDRAEDHTVRALAWICGIASFAIGLVVSYIYITGGKLW